MFVNIPNIEGYGLKLAAAVGALCGDSSCHLEVLHNVTPQCVSDAKELAAEAVTVELAENVPDVYVNVTLKTANHIACVVISDRHDLVTEIMLDDKVLFSDTANERDYPDLMYATNLGDLGDLYEFVMNVPLDKLNLIELSIEHNYKIALEGLQSDYGLMVGRIMHKTTQTTQTKNTLNPNTSSLSQMINHVVSITAAGTDARMAGISLPVMSNSGSGNQGICATVPVVAVAEQLDSPYENLLRAVLLSHLITILIKRNCGRLSAMCGAIIAATGASCGIVMLMNGDLNQIQAAFQNMFGNVTGMVCDGAKAGCALKVATCVFAAMQSAIIALEGTAVGVRDGIIESDTGKTIDNLRRLSQEGMVKMNDILIDILTNKT